MKGIVLGASDNFTTIFCVMLAWSTLLASDSDIDAVPFQRSLIDSLRSWQVAVQELTARGVRELLNGR